MYGPYTQLVKKTEVELIAISIVMLEIFKFESVRLIYKIIKCNANSISRTTQ
jgi:hypothetical protein